MLSATSRFERKSPPTVVSPNGIVEKKSDEIIVTPSDNVLEKLNERPGFVYKVSFYFCFMMFDRIISRSYGAEGQYLDT